MLALNLFLRRVPKQVADGIPEGVAGGAALSEVERARPVRGARGETVPERGLARGGVAAGVARVKRHRAHVHVHVAEVQPPPELCGGVVVQLLGLSELALGDDSGALEVVGPSRPAAVAQLRAAVAGAGVHLARQAGVGAEGSLGVGRAVPHIGLSKRSYKLRSLGWSLRARPPSPLLHEQGGRSFVVGRYQLVRVVHARAVHCEPVDGSASGAVPILQPQLDHDFVHIVLVPRTLLCRVLEVCAGAAVDVCIQQQSLVEEDAPGPQVVVRALDALHDAVHNRVQGLLHEP
mmetsp:Transcript_15941/g.30717  ORF Transcript_15941/g.30717 Transcript_15941/m.30717 type:complete len:291 (+) Transcript_15941:1145-2017(+)